MNAVFRPLRGNLDTSETRGATSPNDPVEERRISPLRETQMSQSHVEL